MAKCKALTGSAVKGLIVTIFALQSRDLQCCCTVVTDCFDSFTGVCLDIAFCNVTVNQNFLA